MRRFSSISDSDRAIADITLGTNSVRSYARPFIIGRTTGMADIGIIAAIIVVLTTGTSFTGIATGVGSRLSSQSNCFLGELQETCWALCGLTLLILAKPPVWPQGFYLARRSGILFSTAGSVPVFPFASPFRSAGAVIVRLFVAPGCIGIQTGRVPVH